MRFLKIGDASKELCISIQTLRKWIDEDKIPHRKTPGGHRLIDIDAYIEGKTKLITPETEGRKSVFYCRVSSSKQRDDLERQVSLAQEKYPNHEIIKDIGSGISWKRKGILSVLEGVMRGEIKEVVVFHRDRLCRFGYDLIEFIFKSNNASLVVHDDLSEEHKSTEQELAEDLMAIVTVFSCRQMGKRRYRTKDSTIENNENLSDSGTEKETSGVDE
jgi:predicted site-specific integrase-resolvase